MGSGVEAKCRRCGTQFQANVGGGFFFDVLHCDACGRERSISHGDLGNIHLGYIKGLGGPYAVARAEQDRLIQEQYKGDPLSREDYESEVERFAGPCECGGVFRFEAPPRCPKCGSLEDEWEQTGSIMYD